MALSKEEHLFIHQVIARRKAIENLAGESENVESLLDIGIAKDDELDLSIRYFDGSRAEVGDIPLYFRELKRASFLEGRLEDEFETKITCPRLMDKFKYWYKIPEDREQNAVVDLPIFERDR